MFIRTVKHSQLRFPGREFRKGCLFYRYILPGAVGVGVKQSSSEGDRVRWRMKASAVTEHRGALP